MFLIDPKNDDGTVKLVKDYPIKKAELIERSLLLRAIPISNSPDRHKDFLELRYIHTITKSDELLEKIMEGLRSEEFDLHYNRINAALEIKKFLDERMTKVVDSFLQRE